MKKSLFHAVVLMGLAFLATACQPDSVQPHGDHVSNPAQRGGGGDVSPQGPLCSDSVYARLQDSTGGYIVNYCVPNCPTTIPEWGRVELYNSADSLSVRVRLAIGWFIQQADLGFGLGHSTLQVDPVTSRPIINSDWQTVNMSPANTYTFHFKKSDLYKDINGCFRGAMRLRVTKRSFSGTVLAESARYLYLSTKDLTGTTFQFDASGNILSSAAIAPSTYQTQDENIINWCWQTKCAPKVPGGIFQTSQCLSAPATPAYTCNATGAGAVTAGTVRCLDTDSNFGTINCTGPGTLVIPAGRTVTCAISAASGCTLIVAGTLNWINTASYNGNMYIYVAPGGVLNRAGSTGSLATNGTGSLLVNAGTIDIDANLVSKGFIYNTGMLTTRNLTVSGGTALFSNTGTAIVEQNLTVTCGSPSTCTASAESSVRNCGRLDVNTGVTTSVGTMVRNYCTLISRGSFTLAGTFVNQGVTVAGLTGSGNGFVHNGTITFEDGSVLVTRFLNWGGNKTITVNSGNAWIITANTTLSGNAGAGQPLFSSIGGTGRMLIPSSAMLLGAGELHLVDADPFSAGDAPSSLSATRSILSQSPTMLVTTRPVGPSDNSIATCAN